MELARALAGPAQGCCCSTRRSRGSATAEADEVVAGRSAGWPAQAITIVIIEHTMQAMVRLVDRFVVLDHGAVLVDGEPDVIIRDRGVIEAYLGKRWSTA